MSGLPARAVGERHRRSSSLDALLAQQLVNELRDLADNRGAKAVACFTAEIAVWCDHIVTD